MNEDQDINKVGEIPCEGEIPLTLMERMADLERRIEMLELKVRFIKL